MAATEDIIVSYLNSVVEDVLKMNGVRFNDLDLASRNSEEASLTRYEAAGWLRKTVGVVGGKDLPAEPSEEEFRLGLRSGILLCNVLNKIEKGAVGKVVEGPCDSVLLRDGATLSASQYLENVRNFLEALEEMGLPTFEVSDLEKGGESTRIVNCVLALMSYADGKQDESAESWRNGRNLKSNSSEKQFSRKNSERFTNSFSKVLLTVGKQSDDLSDEQNSHGSDSLYQHDMVDSSSLTALVHTFLMDKTQEEIPFRVFGGRRQTGAGLFFVHR